MEDSDIQNYIRNTENAERVEELKSALSKILDFVPVATENWVVNILSLLPQEYHEKLLNISHNEQIINDKALMARLLGDLASFRARVDGVEAELVMENKFKASSERVIKEQTELMTNAVKGAVSIVEDVVKDLDGSASKLKLEWSSIEKKIETRYAERDDLAQAYWKGREKEAKKEYEMQEKNLDKLIEAKIVDQKRAITEAVVKEVSKKLEKKYSIKGFVFNTGSTLIALALFASLLEIAKHILPIS